MPTGGGAGGGGARPSISHGEYERSHMKAPRGRGSWAFSSKRNPNIEDVKFFNGTLTQAKQAAGNAFRGATEIHLLP